MKPRRNANRTDSNQTLIAQALREAGCFVHLAHSAGRGFPDLVVSYRGAWILIEVKDPTQPPSKRKLTPAQLQFHELAQAPVYVALTPEEALRAVGIELARQGLDSAST